MSERENNKMVAAGVAWKFGERLIAQGVSFVVSLILARLLSPEDYGVVAIVNVFINIAAVFVTSGLNTALVQKKDATETDFSTITVCSMALAGLVYFALFFGAGPIAVAYGMPILKQVIRVLSLQIPISAINSIQIAHISKKMQFKKFFFSTLIGTSISAAAGIYLAVKGCGVWALVVQSLSNTALNTAILGVTSGWKVKLAFSKESARPLVKYGWKVLATDLFGAVFNQLQTFLIGSRYSSADLAYYTKGDHLPTLIASNISVTLSTVLFPAISNVNDDMSDVKRMAVGSNRMTAYVICPMMAGMIAVAEPLITVLFTEKWLFAVPFLCFSALSHFLSVIGYNSIQVLKAIGRSDLALKAELVKKPVFLVIILVAVQFGVLAIGMTVPITAFLAAVANAVTLSLAMNYSFWEQVKDAIAPMALSLVMGIITACIGLMFAEKGIVCLTVQLLVGIISYIVMSLVTKNDSFFAIWNMLKKSMKKNG